jgi:hypothetical protein
MNLCIWHLPAEKTFGIYRLYEHFIYRQTNYGLDISNEKFISIVRSSLGIPFLPLMRKLEYYTLSYYRALKKRFSRLSLTARFS